MVEPNDGGIQGSSVRDREPCEERRHGHSQHQAAAGGPLERDGVVCAHLSDDIARQDARGAVVDPHAVTRCIAAAGGQALAVGPNGAVLLQRLGLVHVAIGLTSPDVTPIF
jgi:hypothetical protein